MYLKTFNSKQKNDQIKSIDKKRFQLHISFLLIYLIIFQPMAALAFKPKTHVWVGQQVLNDVVPDGKVTIKLKLNGQDIEKEYPVNAEIVESLRQYPNEYRMGHIGPDAFPDPVVGQMTAHPGIPNAWQTDNWLAWMLRAGRTDPKLRAFSYGYLGHASGDFFAHTYVNTYAGDIFVLTDGEQTNEKRHFAIESFIAKHTPPLIDHKGQRLSNPNDYLNVPANELRNFFLLNDVVQKQYEYPDALAAHLVYMKRFRDVVDKTANAAKELPLKYKQQISILDAAKIVAAKKAEEYLGPIAQAKYNVQAAQLVLNAYDKQLAVQQKIIEESKNGIEKAQNLKQKADEELLKLPEIERNLRNRLEDIERELLRIPQTVLKEVCREERRREKRWISIILGRWEWIWITETVCRNERVINDAWEKATNLKRDLNKQINNTVADIKKFTLDKQLQIQNIQTFTTAKLAAEAEHARIKALRDADEKGQKALDEAKAKLDELEEARKKWVDERIKVDFDIKTLSASLSINVNPLYDAINAWRGWIDRAMEEYIKMSGQVAIELAKDKGNPLKPISDWFSCWGLVFLAPVPSVVCEVKNFLTTVLDKISGIREDIRRSLGIFGWLIDPIGMFEDLVKAELMPIAKDVGIKLAGVLLGKETQFLLEIIVQEVDDGNLEELFSKDESNKNLLLIPDISKRIKSDMSLSESGLFNPEKFNAAYNAVVLSKLALLEPEQLNQLVKDFGINGSDIFYNTADFNILVGAVRSIDGNHQWNEYAPPYLRRNNVRDERTRDKRTYGYKDGFLLWSNPTIQKKVFPKLFRGPIAPAMETPEEYNFTRLIPKDYPYKPSTKTPFPKIRDYEDRGSFFKFWK